MHERFRVPSEEKGEVFLSITICLFLYWFQLTPHSNCVIQYNFKDDSIFDFAIVSSMNAICTFHFKSINYSKVLNIHVSFFIQVQHSLFVVAVVLVNTWLRLNYEKHPFFSRPFWFDVFTHKNANLKRSDQQPLSFHPFLYFSLLFKSFYFTTSCIHATKKFACIKMGCSNQCEPVFVCRWVSVFVISLAFVQRTSLCLLIFLVSSLVFLGWLMVFAF